MDRPDPAPQPSFELRGSDLTAARNERGATSAVRNELHELCELSQPPPAHIKDWQRMSHMNYVN